MRLGGRPHAPRSPRAAIAAGVGYVPEDRQLAGLFADLTVRENASATVLSRYWRHRIRMDRRREHAETRALVRRHGVHVQDIDQPISSLSGGNQQKVVLAKWTRRRPALLLLDEPTQGVDVTSRAEIYATLRALADDGCAVLTASTDLDELLVLCDRILVLGAGTVTHEFDAATTPREALVDAVLGGAASAHLPDTDGLIP